MKKILMNPRGLWIMAAMLAIGMIGCNRNVSTDVEMLTTSYNGVVNNNIQINNVPMAGGTYNIGVSSNMNWMISVPSSETWVTVSPSSGSPSGDTPTEVTITVAANTGVARNVQLTVATTEGILTRPVIINQLGSDSPGANSIYYEDLGDYKDGAAIRSVSGITSGWPTITQFGSATPTQAWRRGGIIDQSNVTYGGTGSVRNSGANWDSDPEDSGSATAPYVYQSGTNAQTFLIEGIDLGGRTNLTFNWIMQDTQSSAEAPGGGYIPTTNPITPQTIVFEAGFNGQTYVAVPYSVGTVIGNGWTNVSAEFRVPSGTTNLYIRFSGFAGGQGLRMDNFSLIEGGSGPEINPGDPVAPTETNIAALNARITTTSTPVGNYFMKAIVVTDMARGNYTNGSLSVMTENATTAGNGILLYGEYNSGIVFADSEGNPLYNAGDELEINLSTLSMQAYRGSGASGSDPYVNELIIPTGTDLNNIITRTRTGVTLTPVTITYNQIADYQNMLVQIATVQSLADNITTWPSGTTNFTFRDDPATTFPAYLANTSEIVNTAFSTGNGTLQGIAYVYGGSSSAHSVAQLVPRSTTEVAGLTGARITGETSVLGVSSEAISVPAAGGSATVDVTGNVAWTAAVTVGAANITSGPTPTGGTGAGTITLVFPENTDTANTKTVTLRVSTTAAVTPNFYDVVFTQSAASAPGVHTATFDFAVLGAGWPTSGSNPLTGDAAIFTDGDVTLTFDRGTHTGSDPSGVSGVVRMYALANPDPMRGNTLTVATSSGTITNIEFTYGTTAAAGFAASTGTFASPYATWTGSAASVIFSVYSTTTSNQQRWIQSVVVTYQ